MSNLLDRNFLSEIISIVPKCMQKIEELEIKVKSKNIYINFEQCTEFQNFTQQCNQFLKLIKLYKNNYSNKELKVNLSNNFMSHRNKFYDTYIKYSRYLNDLLKLY
jgi:hypothetical protein